MDIPTTEPTEFYPGDTLKWNRQDLSGDYPASTWTLTYYFRGPNGTFNITASADGEYFAVSVAPAVTTLYKSGDYTWTAKVSDGTDTYTVGQGNCTLKIDLTTKGAGYDPRSHVKKTLDALEAAILKKASKDQLSTQVDGIAIQRMTPEQMLVWRDKYNTEYQAELMAERVSKGLGSGNKIKTRFI